MFFKKDTIFICVKNTIFAKLTKFYFMKKFLSLILLIILGFNVKAQTSLTEAVDFTGTDCYGEETINLFEILDRGQHVLIDFYFYSCPPCQRVVPYVVEAYEAFGCNNHDVFFMEVTHSDDAEIAQWWAEKYGVQYPTISRELGGKEIQQAYNIPSYPSLVLIAPDRKILLQDINYDSIKARETQYIIEQLEQFGIEQHSCDAPAVDVAIGEVTPTEITATFTPSDCASYHFMLSTEAEMEQWTTMFAMSEEDLVVSWGIEKNETYTYTWDEQTPNTEYTIYVLPKDAEGNALPMETKKVLTGTLGGNGVSVITLDIEVMSNTSVFVTATPNEETAEYHCILIEKPYADSIGVDSTMKVLQADPYPLYQIDEWEWVNLNANTEFYAIAQGKNAQGEWGEITKVEFITSLTGNAEMFENDFNIYPNPVNDRLYIETQTLTQTLTIEIYDIYGRRQELSAISGQQSVINVANLNSGIYFVKIKTENGEVVKRFIKK